MQKIIAAASACALGLALSSGVWAAGAPQKPCTAGQSACQLQLSQNPAKGTQAQKRIVAPKRGESARRAPLYQQAKDSRFPAPPTGQEYRVQDGYIVSVDKKSHKIKSILGLRKDLEAQTPKR